MSAYSKKDLSELTLPPKNPLLHTFIALSFKTLLLNLNTICKKVYVVLVVLMMINWVNVTQKPI